MRWIWFGAVVLIVGGMLANAAVSVSSAVSAIQASQLYNEEAALFLGLIAITVALIYAGGLPGQPRP